MNKPGKARSALALLPLWLLRNTSTENLLTVGNTKSSSLFATMNSGAQRF